MNVLTSMKELSEESLALGKKIGKLEMREAVHGWTMRHLKELSADSMRELYSVIGLELPARDEARKWAEQEFTKGRT